MVAAISRPELSSASDATIDDAVQHADPMVLRGLLFQLTNDPEVANTKTRTIFASYTEVEIVVDEDVPLLRKKAADYLKKLRDSGTGDVDIGPRDRLPKSLGLLLGRELKGEDLQFHVEELALDPSVRSLQWKQEPDPAKLAEFNVVVVGSGMGGLNAMIQLRNAGFPFTCLEKNDNVGGTWYENRYPGARVDTPSRSYTHLFGVDFPYPNPFCGWTENVKYFNWVADKYDLKKHVQFNTEVKSLVWDDAADQWVIEAVGPEGKKTLRARWVITSVGFLNRPNMPDIPGMDTFEGPSWHTARWPKDFDHAGKRVVVVGTGATGYQLIPEVALTAKKLTVFQRTPQWLLPTPGYRSPFPPQVNWLDRNLPFHTNFMRAKTATLDALYTISEIDPNFKDPYAVNQLAKTAQDTCIAFLQKKLEDPELVKKMTPPHPIWSARGVVVDSEYSVVDAIKRDNVELVTCGIDRIVPHGVVDKDGVLHDADAIVYATGFHATEYLYPMTIIGRGGQKLEDLWKKEGARAYLGCMVPGFPNLFSVYGPNTNGGLQVATFHEKTVQYALQCMEEVVRTGGKAIEVISEAFWRYNRLVDERNRNKCWSDKRARNYYWTEFNRSAVMCPFNCEVMSGFMRKPDFKDMEITGA